MGRIANTYLQYGVSSELAMKYESLGITVTNLRTLSIEKAIELYHVPLEEVKSIKKCITRQPIDDDVVQRLLENSNFVCCCCKGIKSDSYIIHHIEEYEISQDNTYDNLAVLCLNDHDLAHSASRLTNRLTPEQIRKSKLSWEQEVIAHNSEISQVQQRDIVLSKLPKYKELTTTIELLKKQIGDKEKLLIRSEAFFDSELNKFKCRINELESEKVALENQIAGLITEIKKVDFSKSSEQYQLAINYLMNGEIEMAISVLDEAKLDEELNQLQDSEEKLIDTFRQNADSRMLKAKLLLLECNFEDAKNNALKSLQVYEKLCIFDSDKFLVLFVSKIEQVGTIYYNAGDYENALEIFSKGIHICNEMSTTGEVLQLPIYATIIQHIGACYYSIDDIDKSLEFLIEADSIFRLINEVHNKYGEFDNSYFEYIHLAVMGNLGTSYNKFGDKEKALESYLKGYSICERLITLNKKTYLEGIFRFLNGLASLYFYEQDYRKAQDIYLKIYPIAKQLCENQQQRLIGELADFFRDICASYFLQNDYNNAKPYCDDAISLFRQIGASQGAEMHMHMVDTLVYELVIINSEEHDSEKTIQLATEALEICKEYPDNIDAQEYPEIINFLLKQFQNR